MIDLTWESNPVDHLQAESNSGADMANTVMQKFWDSALNLDPPDDYDDSQRLSHCFF